MGQNKKAIRQNVLEGDNLPNAILNAVIAGFDSATIVNDTIEVLQQGETSSFMFEATPDAIEQFADTFVAKVRTVAQELREFEYIDKPVIRRRTNETLSVQPDAEVGQDTGVEATPDEGIADDGDDGIEVESAEAVADDPLADTEDGTDISPDSLDEETVRKVAVEDVDIDAILASIKPAGDGKYTGKVALKFPNNVAQLGTVVSGGVEKKLPVEAIDKQGIDVDELGEAVIDYALDFIARNAEERFGGMDSETARRTLKFTDSMAFSKSNDRALVSTFEVGGE